MEQTSLRPEGQERPSKDIILERRPKMRRNLALSRTRKRAFQAEEACVKALRLIELGEWKEQQGGQCGWDVTTEGSRRQ